MTVQKADLDRLLALAEQAARTGGEIARTHSHDTVTDKGDRDLVSEADLASEAAIRDLLTNQTPDIPILGEEGGGPDLANGFAWVVDPIDGTVNHLHGLPNYAVAVSLLHDSRAVLAATYLPASDAMYSAIRGRGAQRDGKPIHTSATTDLRQAVVVMDQFTFNAADPEAANRARLALVQALIPAAGRIRMHGCSAVDLVWVADGKLDAAIFLANDPWDTSGGVLIAREAGAVACDVEGIDHRTTSTTTVAAANASIAAAIVELASTVWPEGLTA